jgi:hypothetical protein
LVFGRDIVDKLALPGLPLAMIAVIDR